MKKKVLALAGCIAATASSTSIADVLPENLFGYNLGEIRSSSFLNQPFKGVIPFLFTSVENSKNLSVKLAPEYIFNQVGAEKHPILSSLNFQVTQQGNKPVILISSDLPIQLPFLNFILEIQGPDGSVYQDYTVLLDPKSKQSISTEANYVDVNQFEIEQEVEVQESMSPEEILRANGTLLLASLSSRTMPSTTLSSDRQNPKYRVRAGDSLSKIAQTQDTHNASLSTMSRLIYQKNPRAFIRGDINKIKKGALLSLPTASEINGFEIARKNGSTSLQNKISAKIDSNTKAIQKVSLPASTSNATYTVKKGDSLSKITQRFASKEISFTKMMNAIHSNNPKAFVGRSKNKIKAGAELNIPVFAKSELQAKQNLSLKEDKVAKKKSVLEKKSVSSPKVAQSSQQSQVKLENAVENGNKGLNVTTPEVVELGLNENQYIVKKGDNLSIITKKIGHKGVPFAKMLKAIYVQNPDAFVDGSMAQLAVGSMITLPPLDSFSNVENVSKLTDTAKTKMQQFAQSTPAVSSATITKTTEDSSNLIKRIRELRKELKQSKDNLSEMKERLSDKEILLQQKNMQLESLNASLGTLNGIVKPVLVPVSAVKPVNKSIGVEQASAEDTYRPISKAEMAKLKRDLLNKKKKTQEQLEESEQANQISEIPTYNASLDKQQENNISPLISDFIKKNYPYLTLSLLLGLLLIRYRREILPAYSGINYDHPNYYPVPDSNKYELKETNINHHDPKMDEDSYVYEDLMPNLSDQANDDEETEIVIDPVLVEATEEIFEGGFEGKDESKQIEHCEHLVTELFDDLDTDENMIGSSEWKNIEKVCDNYIEKIKDTDNDIVKNEDGELVDGVTDFNHMMTDLLESLDKVDKSVKKYNISDDDFPEIVKKAQKKVSANQKTSKLS